MIFSQLLKRLEENSEKDALIWKDKAYKYKDLLILYQGQLSFLDKNNIKNISVVIESDFTPQTIALILALTKNNCIISLILRNAARDKIEKIKQLSSANFYIVIDEDENLILNKINEAPNLNEILLNLDNKPRLIIFSSGSTGESKGVVHNFEILLSNYQKSFAPYNMIAFLLFDHIGGIDTLFRSLFSGGCLIFLKDRNPLEIAKAIEKYKVEILPVSPSFLNMFLLYNFDRNYDFSSIKILTYGAEPINESTLTKAQSLFKNAKIKQRYGLSELGIINTKSLNNSSAFIKFADDNVNYRIVDNMLEIKSKISMVGYLNAENPFTEDGWFKTGDFVEVANDGYLKILGRQSELINIGGQKVFPQEIENCLMQIPQIEDVLVKAQHNAILGNIIVANLVLRDKSLSQVEIKKIINDFCAGKIDNYKIPQKINIVDKVMSDRYKKNRNL
jgi:acyl-coenzyme A synthetase/AMP-(fatty) acid ligase